MHHASTPAASSGKVVSLSEAVAAHVRDGDIVFVGGFGHAIPYAAAHEVIRQGRESLTLCRSGADVVFDQMIAAGCVSKVIFGYIGNPGVGLAHSFGRAIAEGALEIEEWTNFSLCLRFHAAVLGVPFLPTRVLRSGEIPNASIQVQRISCPFTSEELTAVPALEPDVAIIHAQQADEKGNVRLWGVVGDSVDGALASRRIIVTVEQIVPTEEIRRDPNRTVIPAYRVDALCLVPWGAHPSYVEGFYARDDAFFREYDRISRSPEGISDYLSTWVHGVRDRGAYVAKLGPEQTNRLATTRQNGGGP